MTTTAIEHRAEIDGITISSQRPFIVYGSVRGLISEHKLLRAAQRSLEADHDNCAALGDGAYSDAAVYCWDDEDGWVADATGDDA